MALAYSIRNQQGLYFVTFTVHQWVDVFTRQCYADILLESIQYCQTNKGLYVYGWVVMNNHCHLILSSSNTPLSDIIRDLKKYTSKRIIEAITNNEQERRRRWLLWLLKKDGGNWFWEEGYHGEEIFSQAFFDTKLNYIHLNPVRAGLVEKEEEYLNSSCADYYGIRKGRLVLAEF